MASSILRTLVAVAFITGTLITVTITPAQANRLGDDGNVDSTDEADSEASSGRVVSTPGKKGDKVIVVEFGGSGMRMSLWEQAENSKYVFNESLDSAHCKVNDKGELQIMDGDKIRGEVETEIHNFWKKHKASDAQFFVSGGHIANYKDILDQKTCDPNQNTYDSSKCIPDQIRTVANQKAENKELPWQDTVIDDDEAMLEAVAVEAALKDSASPFNYPYFFASAGSTTAQFVYAERSILDAYGVVPKGSTGTIVMNSDGSSDDYNRRFEAKVDKTWPKGKAVQTLFVFNHLSAALTQTAVPKKASTQWYKSSVKDNGAWQLPDKKNPGKVAQLKDKWGTGGAWQLVPKKGSKWNDVQKYYGELNKTKPTPYEHFKTKSKGQWASLIALMKVLERKDRTTGQTEAWVFGDLNNDKEQKTPANVGPTLGCVTLRTQLDNLPTPGEGPLQFSPVPPS